MQGLVVTEQEKHNFRPTLLAKRQTSHVILHLKTYLDRPILAHIDEGLAACLTLGGPARLCATHYA